MGLLDYIIQSGQATKRNIRSLLDDPSGYTNALLNRGVENTQAHLNKLTGKPYNQGNDQAYQDAMNEAALAALTVYHGSPHKFDKFDMNKIGTGEGAQAYGHGLYFAEKKGVANEYKKNLSGDATIKKNGRNIATLQPNGTFTPLTTDDYLEASSLAVTEGNIDSAISNLNYEIGNTNNISFINRAKEAINNLKTQKYEYNGGSLYKVDIPDEAIPRMLDWDSRLVDQPKNVIEVLKNMGFEPTGRQSNVLASDLYKELGVNDISGLGEFAYKFPQRISGHTKRAGYGVGREATTRMLHEQGIPGIRYLDGGSRGAGTGTSNFVLFDDQMPRILERNGVPTGLQPWQPGEWTGLLGR